MWPYLLAFSGVPALLQLVGLFFFPDSPRYLFIDKGNEEGCVRALTQLWGKKDFKKELEDMAKERDKMKGQKAKTVLGVLRNKSVRWQMLTLVFPCAGVQLCGINASFLIERTGRKKLMGIGYALMATVLGILVLMLFLKALIGQFCFLIFMMYCVLAAAFTLLFVPETKGKTMLEIAEDFNKLNFKGRRSQVEGMQKEDFIIATKL
ncbi:UNVERIFIED_CONTAM: hypothetical protein FKN15_047069 [Acipenser sinensis]